MEKNAAKELKIIVVCGCGMGSSVILKMNAERVLKEQNVRSKVEVSDATTGKGAASNADLIIVSKSLAYLFKDSGKPVIELTDLVNRKEIEEKLLQFLKNVTK